MFFNYPPDIKKMIFIIYLMDNLNRQFRNVNKNRSVFPVDDALTKMIYFAYKVIANKLKFSISNWGTYYLSTLS